MRGRGLKRLSQGGANASPSSPSMRGRGLKRAANHQCGPSPPSPSMRGRGLKLRPREAVAALDVALHAGAWIETFMLGYH